MRQLHRTLRAVRTALAFVLFVVFSVSVSVSVAAQDAQPLEELEPTRVEASVAPVAAVVRDMPPLPPLPLDEAALTGEIAVDPAPPIAVPRPEIPRDAVTSAPMISGEDQVYFNATLGGGSVNSILGSINVYRLGDGPQFRVGYDHRGSDGFNLKKPGTGFFEQENDLTAWLRLDGAANTSLEVDTGYADRRFGLQQLSPYYSQDLREFDAKVTGAWTPERPVGVRATVAVSDVRRVLSTGDSGVDAQSNGYRRFTPELSGSLEWPRFGVDLTGRYDGLFLSGMELKNGSSFAVQVGVEAVPLDGLTLGVTGITQYHLSDGVYFPVEGYLSYQGSRRWNLDLSGGYRVVENDLLPLWSAYPATEVEPGTTLDESRLPVNEVLFVGGELGVVVVSGAVEVRGRVDRELHTNRLTIAPFQEERSVYPYRLTGGNSLSSDVVGEFSLGESVRLDAGWRAEWDQRLPGVPQHVARGAIRGDVRELTMEATGEVPLVTGMDALPELGIELRYEIARDVEFRAYAHDILAPGMDDGRSLRGVVPEDDDPFIGPGLELGAAVRVRF
ncbi:MAG: hypothetical protein PF508_02560 [Spirochaeta sp.]|jgi:hypothetical protein|nr:hypothetical protein [Spirochaeta sp.]